MEGIKYVQRNRLVVDTLSPEDNAPLKAEGSNAVVTENEIWFDPPVPDFSDLEEAVNSWNADMGVSSLSSFIVNYNIASKYQNRYGFVCGVISYDTSRYVCGRGLDTVEAPGEAITKTNGELLYPEDELFDFYDGNEQFWYLQNSQLNENAQHVQHYEYYASGSSGSSLVSSAPGCLPAVTDSPLKYYGADDDALKILPGENWSKLRFYCRSRILAPGQVFLTTSFLTSASISGLNGQLHFLKPNFTGNSGVLPVGLVMLRDMVEKTSNRPLNNFGEYGFVIAMPFFIEPAQTVRGFSLGKEIFVVGNGLKVEVFFAITTDNHAVSHNVVSNANLGDGSDGNLDALFSGENGALRLSSGVNAQDDATLSCTNVYHDIIDFSISGNTNGVFYFNTPITYGMGVKYLIFGMRPYDINGNGKEYPPKTNPYGTDTSYLGNYALIDISDKKFYLL